ncbi:MAG: DNA internalization-related competence protein ComEC/Rec2 [Cellvibrionales bacterium]|nr:DNA internalization-related competence protein ComEC/Rec2 [Cellvibrionales bacterium]
MKQSAILLAFAVGVFCPNFFPALPDFAYFLGVGIPLAVVAGWRRWFWLLGLVVGLGVGLHSAQQFADGLWPERLNGAAYRMEGRVAGVVRQRERSWRFDFVPTRMVALDSTVAGAEPGLPRRVRLAYYGHDRADGLAGLPVVQPGQELVLVARLRRPHGLMNPGLFDYQRWMIGKGYGAGGSVRKLERVGKLGGGIQGRIDRWRAGLAERLYGADVPRASMQAALLVGVLAGLDEQTREVFVATGTVHLLVISGLHVGLIALLGWVAGRWLLSLVSPVSGLNAVRWANFAALALAGAYAAAGGFSLPTLRALLMLAAVLLPRLFFLRVWPWWSFCLALAAVALFEPRAVLTQGFWLSFGAVAVIFLGLTGRAVQNHGWVVALVRTQMLFLFGFAAMLALFQGSFNPLSFVANLFAVPLTTLVVVPLEFFGLLVFAVYEQAGLGVWRLVGRLLDFEVWVLAWLAQQRALELVMAAVPTWVALVSVTAGFVLISPVRLWMRAVAALLVLPLFISPGRGDYLLEVRVFDVGQGLAVLVRQPGYSMLYDTGPRFSEQFDAGADILAPSLRRLRVRAIDDLIISHPDIDHAGGFAGLLRRIEVRRLWAGRIDSAWAEHGPRPCHAGVSWRQGAVRYAFLHPRMVDPGERRQPDNERSCVLSIRFGDQHLLIPGDISHTVERDLVAQFGRDLRATLVLVPHHGSRFSSTAPFVRATAPEYAIASAGYFNQFGHPHPQVVARYRNQGAQFYRTDQHGMVRLRWAQDAELEGIFTEDSRRVFWWQR